MIFNLSSIIVLSVCSTDTGTLGALDGVGSPIIPTLANMAYDGNYLQCFPNCTVPNSLSYLH